MSTIQTSPAQLPLCEVAHFVRGINFKPSDVKALGSCGTVACMRTRNVQDTIDLSDVWAVDSSLVKRDEQYLREGDVLVSSANSWNLVGKCCYIPGLDYASSFGGFVSVLRALVSDLEPRYLFRWFSSPRIQTTVRSFGQQTTNIANLNLGRCLELKIPFPPLAEQRRIADILDRAEALRARRRAALAQLDSLTQAIFLEMFGDPALNSAGWEVVSLGDVMADGPQNGLYKHSSAYGQGTKILRIDAFYDGVVTDVAALKRVLVTSDEQELYALRAGDVVINRVNSIEFVGKCALIPDVPERIIFESNMMRVHFSEKRCDPRFIVELLQTPFIKAQIRKRAKQAINQASINQTDVRSLTSPLPPVHLQTEFAHRAAAVERLKTTQRAHMAELDALFSSLQHRAFRGEL